MALPGNKNFSDYDNYVTDPNPTTSAQAQDYFRNQAELLKAVIDCDFWQPETVYQPGDVVKSDSMPNGTEAVMVATKASVTSNVEPQWGAVGGANISDGACFWKLRWQHWSKEGYAMADYPLRNTAYSLNAIVACPYHAEFMLKCVQAGTTSTGSLDTTSAALGKVYTDGGVKWVVINPLNDYLPLTGGTMNGAIKGNGRLIQLLSPNSVLILGGTGAETAEDGAQIMLYGEEVADLAGYFRIRASTTEQRYTDLVGTPDGSLNWGGVSVLNPVGTIIAVTSSDTPRGYVDCNGASLNPTTYKRLFGVIGTAFGGDGVTSFNLPNLNDGSFLEGSNTVGTVKSAGLPNVVGQHRAFDNKNNTELTGAFYQKTLGGGGYGSYGSPLADYMIGFDARRCSSVYGNSDTVQPKSVTVKFCIKY